MLSFLLLVPNMVFAVSADDELVDISKYETMNFTEILKEENIELKGEYTENDKQATIYLFRGNGCHYCQNFLTFLSSIVPEYGQYFKVVGFEVWSNQENSTLLSNISKFLGSEAGGVPYIVIGDQAFPGYASEYDEGIKAAITDLYNSTDRYDVFEEYNAAVKAAKKSAKGNTGLIVFWNAVITAVGVLVVCCYVKKQNDVVLNKVAALEKKNTVVKEEKKPVEKKKTNAKKKK